MDWDCTYNSSFFLKLSQTFVRQDVQTYTVAIKSNVVKEYSGSVHDILDEYYAYDPELGNCPSIAWSLRVFFTAGYLAAHYYLCRRYHSILTVKKRNRLPNNGLPFDNKILGIQSALIRLELGNFSTFVEAILRTTECPQRNRMKGKFQI